MPPQMTQIKSDKELSNERGKHRDNRFYLHHAAKSGTSSKRIDWMVDHLERLIPLLQLEERKELTR